MNSHYRFPNYRFPINYSLKFSLALPHILFAKQFPNSNSSSSHFTLSHHSYPLLSPISHKLIFQL